MADRLALVIAIDTYQEHSLPSAAQAESDALALARALEALGFAREQQTVLLGSQATKTAIESRLRKMVKTPPRAESLFVFYAGQVLEEGEEGLLTCFDTQPDDLAETSIRLATLLDALGHCSCEQIVLFLDGRADLASGDNLTPHLPLGPLQLFCQQAPGRTCFLSCRSGENPSVSGSLKASVWAHHLLAALTGKAPLALEDNHLLTAASLQEHLVRELPRTLRSSFRDGRVQTPVLVASDERLVLADLGQVRAQNQPGADPRLQQLKRGALRAESTSRVKSLGGYRKFHRLPDRVNASSQKFVADLAAEDVKADVDAYYGAVREHLGYKRRDVEGSADRGTGFVRTPDFEYSVSVTLAPDDPATVIWRREVAAIRNPEVILGKAFQNVFGELFDTLVFEFVKPFDLESWVDHVEEATPEGVKLRCASDCSSCDIVVSGFVGVIRLFRDRVEIQGRKTPTSRGLVEAFLQFQDLFAGQRELQALPLTPLVNDNPGA
jgi:hypothetical protein